jgi:hypothetical protein
MVWLKQPVTLAFVLAIFAFLVKVTLYWKGIDVWDVQLYLVALHLLLILLAVFAAIFSFSDPDYIHLVKRGVQAAAVYAVVSAFLVVVYYQLIEPDSFARRQELLLSREMESSDNKLNEAEMRAKLSSFFSLFRYTTITLASFLVAGAIYALVTALFRMLFLRVGR